jgi:hypothetical protein
MVPLARARLRAVHAGFGSVWFVPTLLLAHAALFSRYAALSHALLGSVGSLRTHTRTLTPARCLFRLRCAVLVGSPLCSSFVRWFLRFWFFGSAVLCKPSAFLRWFTHTLHLPFTLVRLDRGSLCLLRAAPRTLSVFAAHTILHARACTWFTRVCWFLRSTMGSHTHCTFAGRGSDGFRFIAPRVVPIAGGGLPLHTPPLPHTGVRFVTVSPLRGTMRWTVTEIRRLVLIPLFIVTFGRVLYCFYSWLDSFVVAGWTVTFYYPVK